MKRIYANQWSLYRIIAFQSFCDFCDIHLFQALQAYLDEQRIDVPQESSRAHGWWKVGRNGMYIQTREAARCNADY